MGAVGVSYEEYARKYILMLEALLHEQRLRVMELEHRGDGRCVAFDAEPELHEQNARCRCVMAEGHRRSDYPAGHERDHYCRHGNWA